jgi:hypothetical protein
MLKTLTFISSINVKTLTFISSINAKNFELHQNGIKIKQTKLKKYIQ